MRRVLALVLCAGVMAGAFATKSRVLSMGKHDAFFMDETSIFRNPANISIYPNLLMGSYGEYRVLKEDTAGGNFAALRRSNRDPRDPFFGAVLSYSLQQSSEEGSQYPMLSLGAVVNRKDPLLGIVRSADAGVGVDFLDPVGKVDLMLSYALPGGGMIGVGSYIAFQKEQRNNRVHSQTNLYRGTIGMNWPVARTMDLEASLGVSSLTATGITIDGGDQYNLADNDITFEGDVRLFSALTSLNGDFVPQASVKYGQLLEGDKDFVNVAGGIGLNINIDKGFFWAGLQGLYERETQKGADDRDAIGGRISFGIERNVVWDWLVVRVGGKKTVKYVTEGTREYWEENPEHDADNDMVGLGIGLNVENRLRFDILVAEDVVHTLTNLISGPQHHIFTRIDATFSF